MILNHPIRRSLLIAAIYLLTAVVLNELRQRHVVGAETVVRLMGMLMGSVVLVSANAIPKRLVPLARQSCDPAREQTLRRFGGWALVLGGLGYTLAYALAPIAIASTLAIFLLAPAALVVAGITARCAWMRRSVRRGGA
jgi:hypothetical protein